MNRQLATGILAGAVLLGAGASIVAVASRGHFLCVLIELAGSVVDQLQAVVDSEDAVERLVGRQIRIGI